MKKCLKCFVYKNDKDFYEENICYPCQYREKKGYGKEVSKKLCKHCDNEITGYRRTFCSDVCAEEGKRNQDTNYWTRKINAQKTIW